MKNERTRYYGHRFPPEIISYAVWAYHRFCLSFRDVEDLLAQRGIIVSYETIRVWCQKFGPDYARKLKRRQGRLGDIWHLDEVFIRINGQQKISALGGHLKTGHTRPLQNRPKAINPGSARAESSHGTKSFSL